MKWQYIESQTAAKLIIHENSKTLCGQGIVRNNLNESINTFILNIDKAQKIRVDEVEYTLPSQTMMPLMANQYFEFEHPEKLIAWQFNREFYCIVDHDVEVGCVGFLFYGVENPMFVPLNKKDIKDIESIKEMFAEDMQTKDNFQGEMLRALMKRLIIKITRIAKKHSDSYQIFPDEKMDLIRKFSLLLEGNFKQNHEVKFYAASLNKSPKTLANLFALYKHPSPSKLIYNRLVLEAKRYLYYTDKTAKEIAYELGFVSPAHFSRFFKQNVGVNISEFKTE